MAANSHTSQEYNRSKSGSGNHYGPTSILAAKQKLELSRNTAATSVKGGTTI